MAELDKGVGRHVRVRYQQQGETRQADLIKVLARRGSVTATTSRTTGGARPSEP